MRTTEVSVAGVTYTVLMGTKEEVGLPKELMGSCDVYLKVIKVAYDKFEDFETEEVLEVRAKEIIYHELGHAYIHECGIMCDATEEEIICSFLETNLRKMMNSALSVMDDFKLE